MSQLPSYPDFVIHNLTVRLLECGFTDVVCELHPTETYLFYLHCKKDGNPIDRLYSFDDAFWLPVCKPTYFLPVTFDLEGPDDSSEEVNYDNS